MPSPSLMPSDLIAIAVMIFGFGIVVTMFRVQRELWMRERWRKDKNFTHWIPWADWLTFASVLLVGCLTIFPLLAFPVTRSSKAIAAASCGSAVFLQIGYIPSILAHYQMLFGKPEINPPRKVQPAERFFVKLTVAIAALAFAFVFCQQR